MPGLALLVHASLPSVVEVRDRRDCHSEVEVGHEPQRLDDCLKMGRQGRQEHCNLHDLLDREDVSSCSCLPGDTIALLQSCDVGRKGIAELVDGVDMGHQGAIHAEQEELRNIRCRISD
jgi:hypothetical protein